MTAFEDEVIKLLKEILKNVSNNTEKYQSNYLKNVKLAAEAGEEG
jgi:hypothetical protein